MKRNIILTAFFIISLFLSSYYVFAGDSPHNNSWTADNNKWVYCSSCHVIHNSAGPSLTKDANATLCMTCHVSGSLAAGEKPFSNSEQAVPGTRRGWSHNWTAALPLSDNPNNQYGLRSSGSLTNTSLKNAYTKFNGIPCSTCHQQHVQTLDPWDPRFLRPYNGTTHKGPHFQRVMDTANEICVDCHFYRNTYVSSDSSSARYQAWNGNKRSHPVNIIFSSAQGETPNVNDTTQFNTAPREPASSVWTSQTDSPGVHRYKLNGGMDTNLSNNIVLDSTGNVRCMSCHGVHYTDSDSTTIDRSCPTCDP